MSDEFQRRIREMAAKRADPKWRAAEEKRKSDRELAKKRRRQEIQTAHGSIISARFDRLSDFIVFRDNWATYIDEDVDYPFRLFDRPLSEFEATTFLKSGIENSVVYKDASWGEDHEGEWYKEDLIICVGLNDEPQSYLLFQVDENSFEEANNHQYFIGDNWIQFETKADSVRAALMNFTNGETRILMSGDRVQSYVALNRPSEMVRIKSMLLRE